MKLRSPQTADTLSGLEATYGDLGQEDKQAHLIDAFAQILKELHRYFCILLRPVLGVFL